ncbi:DUF389 domain-containing protein [Phycicoccus flavus]|uniref:DUF389 domain-containing protein n=1 Tax=Phycicoccus flavus TaxID=2502783 RepID=UPI000FEBEE84|nr:DUF389 domain-containing protein [Phycicoccus flavus]NHA69382.1 DUF389 domain-containing protein [Phycicoccus flavus]
MDLSLRRLVIPANQRRSLEELSADLDLRSGDRRAAYTAFWTMLTLSAVIATAGVLSDSTATVIGAMIIAPLSTPIMGMALGIVLRRRLKAGRFVIGGIVLVVATGWLFAALAPGTVDLTTNSQVTGRTSPGVLDLVAAVATGFAGALGLARRDVAAVLPGVAIAISLVPPLAVVGVCLGEGDRGAAFGAALLFTSNVVALVLAGTVLFAVLGYAEVREGERTGVRARSYVGLAALLLVVLVPLGVNTALVFYLADLGDRVDQGARRWVSTIPGAEVTSVDTETAGFTVNVRSPLDPPPTSELLADLRDAGVPAFFDVTVELTTGRRTEAGPIPADPAP